MNEASGRWLTTGQAAALLGVKAETIYAYVSRGVLQRQQGADRRSSRFDRAEVERLAARARRGGRASGRDVLIDTEITLLDPAGELYFRGRSAAELAENETFEDVACLLWTAPTTDAWTPTDAVLDAGRLVQAALPAGARPADRIRLTVAAIGPLDPLRHDRRPAAVHAAGRTLVGAAVDCLPELSRPTDQSIAARLWSRLASQPPTRPQLRTLEAALILCADHELAASALAARSAASAWADPYLVVLCGLAAASGPLHGGMQGAVEAMLAGITETAQVGAVIEERRARGDLIPGFGHTVYRDRDPRAVVLLRMLGDAVDPRVIGIVDELVSLVGRYDGPFPNLDLALAALSVGTGMVPGAAEAVFLVARIAGLIAHAQEEYEHKLRFRPRAVYVGPTP